MDNSDTKPTFKVTMLGYTGVGKTVFMAAMYAKLREGYDGLSLTAIDNKVDLELGKYIEDLLINGHWPLCTEGDEKQYLFELSVDGKAIANIDWIDYRGGTLEAAPESPPSEALARRLSESDAVLWLVDMTALDPHDALNTMVARLKTKVGRMKALCQQSNRGANRSRAWVFVRTKSDKVESNGDGPDWRLAVEQLKEHLGPASDVAYDAHGPCLAFVSVSSVGRIADSDKVTGVEPFNVQWPLLLSMYLLFRREQQVVWETSESLLGDLAQEGGRSFFSFLSRSNSKTEGTRTKQDREADTRLAQLATNIERIARTIPEDSVIVMDE